MDYSDSIRSNAVNFSTVATLTDALHEETLTGWAVFQTTCTYASTSSFTISGDYTTTFTKGTPLKFTNSTLKYANVASSSYSAPNTTVNIIVNADYVLANTTISGVYIARSPGAAGFPGWFNFTSSYTGFSANPTNKSVYKIDGNVCTFMTGNTASGTSNAASYGQTLPIACATIASFSVRTFGTGSDNGSYAPNVFITLSSAATSVAGTLNGGSTNFTASGAKAASFTIVYPI